MSGRRIGNSRSVTPTSSFNAGSNKRRDDIGTNISTLSSTISNATLSARSLAANATTTATTAAATATILAAATAVPTGGGNASSSNSSNTGRSNNNNNNNNNNNSNSNISSKQKKGKDGKEFNPRLIFSQIVAMQCFHYFFLGLLFQINYMIWNTSITIDRIFTDEYIKIWSKQGLPDTFAVLLSSIVGAVLLAIIVEKSKKCLDFAFTLFIIHLGFCTAYDGMPRTWDWWIVNILGTIVMILLGEYVCSLREMSDIPLLNL